MFISREDIITNTRKSQEHVASQNHSRVALVGLGSDGNVVTDSDSDVSSEDFYLEDNLLAASSLSSVSAMPQIKIEDFITGISQLFRKDDGIRGTIWKALERSTDELKFDRPKIVRNFSRLLRRYAEELNQNSSTSVEKLVARFVRKKSHSITIALFHTMQPTETLQNRTAIVADQPVEKLMLDRFLDAQAQDANEIKIAETGSQNRNLMRQGKGEEDNASSDESEASYMNLNELQIDYSIEKVEAFMISGIPFANLKQRFQDFVGRSTLNDMPEVDAVRNPEQRDVSSNLIYGEDGMVQIRWQCVSPLLQPLQHAKLYLTAYSLCRNVAINFQRLWSNTNLELPRNSFVTCTGMLPQTSRAFPTNGRGCTQSRASYVCFSGKMVRAPDGTKTGGGEPCGFSISIHHLKFRDTRQPYTETMLQLLTPPLKV